MQTPATMFATSVLVIRPLAITEQITDGIVGGVHSVDDVLYVAFRILRPDAMDSAYGLTINTTDYVYSETWAGETPEAIATAIAADLNTADIGYTATAYGDMLLVAVDDAVTVFDVDSTGAVTIAGNVLAITASVQPFFQGRERKLNKEGQREMEIIAVLTTTRLYDVNEATGKKADLILYDNGAGMAQYEVRQLDHYQMGTLDHNDATCVRVVKGTYT